LANGELLRTVKNTQQLHKNGLHVNKSDKNRFESWAASQYLKNNYFLTRGEMIPAVAAYECKRQDARFSNDGSKSKVVRTDNKSKRTGE
jgi:hypothetical protein